MAPSTVDHGEVDSVEDGADTRTKHTGTDVESDLSHTPRVASSRSNSSSLSNSVVIAVIVTTLLALVVAVVLVVVIVCLVRKQAAESDVISHTPAASTNGGAELEQFNGGFTGRVQQNGNGSVRFSKQKEVLYFAPHVAVASNGAHHVTYQTENAQNDSLIDDVDVGEDCTLPEGITLIPGRDINHDGPLRVYKWEEF